MMKTKCKRYQSVLRPPSIAVIVAVLVLISGCDNKEVSAEKAVAGNTAGAAVSETTLYPLSDPKNTGGWVLNTEVSDEFDGDTIDEERWYVVGRFEDGKPVYKDPDHPEREVWIGRAPAQFSGRNVRLEEGKLKLSTRWDPDFPFTTEQGLDNVEYQYGNFTTAAVINRNVFKYGYMEVRAKAADAEVSSAFWMTRHETPNGQRNDTELELDMFEHFGSHRIPGNEHRDRELWWSIHNWDPELGHENANNVTYTEKHDLGFRVADDFHTYGFEWTETGIRYFIDGKLFTEASRDSIEQYAKARGHKIGYVIDKAMHLWLDSEAFPWRGYPDSKEDLEKNSPEGERDDGVVDFEIEYVRVWQQDE